MNEHEFNSQIEAKQINELFRLTPFASCQMEAESAMNSDYLALQSKRSHPKRPGNKVTKRSSQSCCPAQTNQNWQIRLPARKSARPGTERECCCQTAFLTTNVLR